MIEKLIATISLAIGVQIVLTKSKHDQAFAISFFGKNEKAVAKLLKYLGDTVVFENPCTKYEQDINITSIFFKLKQDHVQNTNA